jgi:hypothetical protein
MFAPYVAMQTVWGFYDKFFANDKDLTDALYKLSEKRGPENEEMTGEITGLAGSFVALHDLHCIACTSLFIDFVDLL